ncbi:MAG TPA: exodeoxyribonuclease III [Fimbriimonadaceae bacterium]|nr:exodeoxyribonuclease III [Fimbriimonadaceae bacterium]
MKIATFNANSIRARLGIVLDWVSENRPDVLAIQETKVTDDDFPLAAFQEAGLNAVFHGQKSYNGVALISPHPIEEAQFGFGDPLWPDDCRILTAAVKGVPIVNTYVPNGTEVGTDKFDYKLRWFERFDAFLSERYGKSEFVWLGDINVAPTDDDVFDPNKNRGKVCFHPDEIARLTKIKERGLIDTFRKFKQGSGHYSYWEFFVTSAFEKNLGWRIDHIYAPESLASKCVSCVIDKAPRAKEKPSDHTFVVAEFKV